MNAAMVIGGGPAGLMAAEVLLRAGHQVTLTEGKPSVGRKLLMAGKSGLNLTKMQDKPAFLASYVTGAPHLIPMINAFGPDDVRAWTEALGQQTFVGSTARLFPTAMKASPLLRAWLARLTAAGLQRRTGWRWQGWQEDGSLRFETPDGPVNENPPVTILALGGASWARLGSDGAWADHFRAADLPVAPFAPSNAGVQVPWSPHMQKHFGAPLKNITIEAGPMTSRGEATLSQHGLEGGGIYALTPALRDGHPMQIDLMPDLTEAAIAARLRQPRGKQSRSNVLRKALRLSPAAQALLLECAHPLPMDPTDLARQIKALRIPYTGLSPIDAAISTAGGVPFDALDTGLMLKDRPGIFCAGEMLDWDAPTGGYLITACLASGRWAGQHADQWLKHQMS